MNYVPLFLQQNCTNPDKRKRVCKYVMRVPGDRTGRLRHQLYAAAVTLPTPSECVQIYHASLPAKNKLIFESEMNGVRIHRVGALKASRNLNRTNKRK
jgi:hypothetical protein